MTWAIARRALDIATQPRQMSWYQASDWERWTEVPVDTIDNTVSLTASNGVGVATGVGGAGNDRRLYLLDGVQAADVEVQAELEVVGGSPGAGQAGLAMRANPTRAVIVWNNIFFGVTGNYLQGVWEYDGTTLHTTNQAALSQEGMPSNILSASGNGTTVTVKTRAPHNLSVGHLIDESITTGSFRGETVAAVPDAVTFTFADTASGTWTTGRFRQPFFGGRRKVAARVVGDRVVFKQWFPEEAPPSWTDPLRATSNLLPAALEHSDGPPPSAGGVGVVAAHLGGGAQVKVHDFSWRILA